MLSQFTWKFVETGLPIQFENFTPSPSAVVRQSLLGDCIVMRQVTDRRKSSKSE
jgi:hypothetical protein